MQTKLEWKQNLHLHDRKKKDDAHLHPSNQSILPIGTCLIYTRFAFIYGTKLFYACSCVINKSIQLKMVLSENCRYQALRNPWNTNTGFIICNLNFPFKKYHINDLPSGKILKIYITSISSWDTISKKHNTGNNTLFSPYYQ